MALKAVLLTHGHYDHLRDIPALGMNYFLHRRSVALYATAEVREFLATYMLNGKLYPAYLEKPRPIPAIDFHTVETRKEVSISGYSVLPVRVNHSVPATGYQVTTPEGKALFFSGDTGPGLAECWEQIHPDVLIIETTAPNRYGGEPLNNSHLTAELLLKELKGFKEMKGYLPQVYTIHTNPLSQSEIKKELSAVSRELGIEVTVTEEGMEIEI